MLFFFFITVCQKLLLAALVVICLCLSRVSPSFYVVRSLAGVSLWHDDPSRPGLVETMLRNLAWQSQLPADKFPSVPFQTRIQ